MFALNLDSETGIREAMEHATKLRDDAITIFNDPEADAESFEKAENMLDEAGAIVTRCQKLQDIKTQADKVLNFPDPEDNEQVKSFDTTNAFLRAVKNATTKNIVDERLLQFHEERGVISTKDMSGNVGATGGFLLTGDRLAGVQSQMAEASIVMPRATVLPMGGRTIDIVRIKQTGTTASQFHWFGGMLAYWEGEADTITSSDMNFSTDTLTARMLAALTYVPNTTLADSGDALASILTGPMGFGGALASEADISFLQGDGVNKPMGVINSGAKLTASRASGGSIGYADLTEIVGKTLPGQNYVWLANIGTRETLLNMSGPSGNASYLWGNATNGIPDRLLGYPIIWTEKVPSLGTAGDIGLYDFSHYYVGNRQVITIDTDTSIKFPQHMTAFKAVARLDGQPWIETYFTLYDGSTTVSPFVLLAA